MPTVDLETLIADFLSLGRRLQELPSLSGEGILEQFTVWYGQDRVIGAQQAEGGDMLLLQWGTTQPFDLSAPTDLRDAGDAEIRFVDVPVRYLDFTRQVFAPTEPDAEFDDEAVQLSLTLCYEPATGDETDANLWIATPEDVANGKRTLTAEPYANALLSAVPMRIVVTVGYCG